MRRFALIVAGAALAIPSLASETPPELLTAAERSGFRATMRHDEVRTLCQRLADQSDRVHLDELGRTSEDRPIPMLVIADPPVTTAAQATASEKPVVLLLGNIHAGEVCGKEALLMLARELTLAETPGVLDELVVVIVPNYNADGNERVDVDNRPGQVGPDLGMGQRHNAQDLDLNRDYVKMAAPETRALARFMRSWDPDLTVDTHTTNGSHHRYTLTYSGPKHPGGDNEIVQYVRDTMLPALDQAMLDQHGWETFFYGNFNNDHTEWRSYPDLPRYGANYRGMRNRLSILSEAYAYAPYEDRVRSTLDFCRATLEYAASETETISSLLDEADRRAADSTGTPITLASEMRAFDDPVTVLGYELHERGVRPVPTDTAVDYEVQHFMRFEPTETAERPLAYLIPPDRVAVIENLQRHGIELLELREDIELEIEVDRVDSLERAERVYEGCRQTRLSATRLPATRRIEAGWLVLPMEQPLASLGAYLLEAESADGLVAWSFFDGIQPDDEYPVLRLIDETPLTTTEARPLAEDRELDRPVTFDTLYGDGDAPRFAGSPVRGLRWLDDGEHYLQVKDGRLMRIEALTGRGTPDTDEAALESCLAEIPTIDAASATRIARRTSFRTNPDRTTILLDHENDLYAVARDGSRWKRLTSTPEPEEVASFSPDGRFVAFVRDNDLWVVDVQTATERALTTGGTETLRNGKASWVYFEEVFGRNWQAYWWRPDSTGLAYLQTDSSPVRTFTITDDSRVEQRLETTRYPKPGQPNPIVRMATVSVAGGSPDWIDLSDYNEGDAIIKRVDWAPDSGSALVQIQNRQQTWLDMLRVSSSNPEPTHLFRETTGAWVRQSKPVFLEDASFLWQSERTGWRHIYHFEQSGSLRAQLTDGDWEARLIELLHEPSGVVFVSGTRDSHTASNLYRVPLDGGEPVRVTMEAGSHGVSVSPNGELIVDTWSTSDQPSRVAIRDHEGTLLRTVDSNPVHSLEEFVAGRVERVQIETSDGFLMEASLTYPPHFDESERYPVWFMTYAGPHAPTVRDSWSRRWGWDQMLAQTGIVVFRCDPRSASGKGAVSAWNAYKRLGESEMADIAEAIEWLCEHPWADASRIGMSGHSYGGFMTAYAMTHSELFAAGIAGAPVTDWRDYDTIYTERYMMTPQDNPDGYRDTSVVESAADLHGRLLLIHGLLDDNVHAQNATRLIGALQKANKPFELMVYPTSRHGIWSTHYRSLMYDFITRTVVDVPSAAAPIPPESASEYEPQPTTLEDQGPSRPR